MRRRFDAIAPLALLIAVVAYGAVLRVDAYVQKYGQLDRPGWANVLTRDGAAVAEWVRPSKYRWAHVDRPYIGGDPINYLKYAREMRSFYQAHVREPLFLALTRTFLWLLSDQDAAVSFASALGSILTIVAAYLLGSALLSRAAGVILAFVFAVEYEVITWAVDGWRDDLFMAMTTFSAWAFVRCRRSPSYSNAAWLGVCCAGACLTRITAVTFVVPGLMWLAVAGDADSRRRRLQASGIALAVAAALVGPYLISCAIETGDPLYAVNYHTQYYRHGEGLPSEKPMSAASYVTSKIARRPFAAIDTAVMGLFVQPFTIKWNGLDEWGRSLVGALWWLAIGGLVAWAFTADGRLLLVVLFGSLLPYMLTWNVAGGGEWRFTMHVYPLYVLAALSAAALLWRLARLAWQEPRRIARPDRKSLWWIAAAATGLLLACGLYIALPWFVVREAIAKGEDVSIETGARDRVFFGPGWTEPYLDGRTFRLSSAERAVVRIPLPSRRQYDIVLRLDPVAPDRQQRAVVLLNGQLLAILHLQWNSERVGAYPLKLAADKIRVGINTLTIVPDTLVPASAGGSRYESRAPGDLLGVRLWYVRVLAPGPAAVSGGAGAAGWLRHAVERVEPEAESQESNGLLMARAFELGAPHGVEVSRADHHDVNRIGGDQLEQLPLAPEDGITLEAQRLGAGVVVDEPNHPESLDGMGEELPKHE